MISPRELDPDRPRAGVIRSVSKFSDTPDQILLVEFPDEPIGEKNGPTFRPAEELRNASVVGDVARCDDTEARIVAVDNKGARVGACLTGQPARPALFLKVQGADLDACEGRTIEFRTPSVGEER